MNALRFSKPGRPVGVTGKPLGQAAYQLEIANLGVAMPEEYGGAGLGVTEAALVMQTVAESGAAAGSGRRRDFVLQVGSSAVFHRDDDEQGGDDHRNDNPKGDFDSDQVTEYAERKRRSKIPTAIRTGLWNIASLNS